MDDEDWGNGGDDAGDDAAGDEDKDAGDGGDDWSDDDEETEDDM